jgi:hypothetical protein
MPTNRASMKESNRSTALAQYVSYDKIVIPTGGAGPGNMLRDLTARFGSFANTVQMRMDAPGGPGGGLGGTLEAQVDQALAQAMRQPGSTATAVQDRPGSASIGALVGGDHGAMPAMSPYQAAMLREGRITQADILSILDSLQPLSPFTDPGDIGSLRALVRAEVNGLLEEFAYSELLPRQQRVRVFLGGLLGWDYDKGHAAPLTSGKSSGDISTLVWLLNLGGPLVPTIPVEDQLASQQVLGNDGGLFDAEWSTFWGNVLQGMPQNPVTWQLWEPGLATSPPVRSGLGSLLPQVSHPTNWRAFGPGGPQLPEQAPWRIGVLDHPNPVSGLSYAEKMIQADLLLPVIAQDASAVTGALNAVGFSAAEQQTTFVTFWSAVDADLLPTYPPTLPSPLPKIPRPPQSPGWKALTDLESASGTVIPVPTPIPVFMTVADVLDWAQNLAGPSSTDQLRQAGALGLNLLCDQADELFWLALAMLDPTASAQVSALADPEVQLNVAALASDLNNFANLAY